MSLLTSGDAFPFRVYDDNEPIKMYVLPDGYHGGIVKPFVLHTDGPCILCSDMPAGEWCRACGYDTRVPTPVELQPPPAGTLARAIWDANGGPLAGPLMRGFA